MKSDLPGLDTKATEKSDRYMLKPLGERQVLQAYPLVQSAVPHLTLDGWLGYTRSLYDQAPRGPGAGVMSAQSGAGYIYGVYCHEVETDAQHGKILKISNFAAANFYDLSGIVGQLIKSMPELARENDCAAVHVELPEKLRDAPASKETLLNKFEAAGYRAESVALCLPLEKK